MVRGGKNVKRIRFLSVLLAALLLVLCAGCGGNDNPQPDYPKEDPLSQTQTDASQTDIEPSAQPEPDGFVYEDLLRENAVSTLVFAYRNVQLLRYENDELCSETYFFDHGENTVFTRRTVDPDSEDILSCGVGDSVYFKDGDHLQYSCYLAEDVDPDADGSFEDSVCAQLMEGAVENIESAGEDLWRFEIRDAEYAPGVVCRCTATKQTLTLKTIEWDYGDGNISRVELRHGDDVKAKDFGLLDGFDKPMRKVTCVCTLHAENGDPTTSTYTVDAPYNAEPLFVHSRELNLYLNKDLTKEYVYPGNGRDYTVYATDAVG